MATSWYVYAIAMQGTPYVKIGMTWGTVAARMRQLQQGWPLDLHLLAVVCIPKHPEAIEKALHARFASCHVRGEWFACAVEQSQLEHLVTEVTAVLEGDGTFERLDAAAAAREATDARLKRRSRILRTYGKHRFLTPPPLRRPVRHDPTAADPLG